jgi:hypothetical protein
MYVILWYQRWLAGVKLYVVYVRTTQTSVRHRRDVEEVKKIKDKGYVRDRADNARREGKE